MGQEKEKEIFMTNIHAKMQNMEILKKLLLQYPTVWDTVIPPIATGEREVRLLTSHLQISGAYNSVGGGGEKG